MDSPKISDVYTAVERGTAETRKDLRRLEDKVDANHAETRDRLYTLEVAEARDEAAFNAKIRMITGARAIALFSFSASAVLISIYGAFWV